MQVKYIPLSFISSDTEIKRQLRHTVILNAVLSNAQQTTVLSHYLQGTQYGYTASANESGTHKLLRITDINDGTVDWLKVPFCDCSSADGYLLAEHDILVARTGGTTGKSFFVKEPPNNAVFASYLIRLRAKSSLNARFIYVFLNSYLYWSQIIELKSGSAQPNVNAEKLKGLMLPDCSQAVQESVLRMIDGIAETEFEKEVQQEVQRVLRNYDRIAALRHELATQKTLLAKLREAILREAVQGKLTHQNPTDEDTSHLLARIKAEKAAKGIKEKPLPPIKPEEIPYELPQGWVWCRLGEIALFGTGATPLTTQKDYYQNGSIPWVTSAATNNQFIAEAEKWITQKALEETNCKLYAPGTLLVAMYGQGKTRGQVSELLIEAATNQACIAIWFVEEFRLLKGYIKIYFQKVYNEIREMASGGAQPNLNMQKIIQSLIPLPPLAEQERIVAAVERLLGRVSALEREVLQEQETLGRLMQSALREAFGSGTVENERGDEHEI
jgi:type I restriction enzyme S subunit